jgi:hypothetical protein
MIPLLSNVAVQDQTVVSNIVTLDNIMSGVDGSATFGYNLETKNLEVNDKQKQQYAHTHTFDIRVVQGTSAEMAILRAVVDNNRNVKVSGHSPDGFFLWDEPTVMVRNSQFDQIVADALLLTHDTTIGYRGTAPSRKLGVYAGDNALALYDILSGSAEVLNGFFYFGTITASVSGMVQSLTRGADATASLLSRNLFFPFVGQTLTLSMTVNSANAGYSFGMDFLDSSGSFVSGSSDSASGTGRKSFNATIPSGAVSVSVYFRPGATSGNTLVFQEPMLSLGGRTQFSL